MTRAMKRIFLSLFSLMAGALACLAAVVPQDRAERVAATFFRQMTAGTKSAAPGALRLVATYPEVKTKAAPTPPTIYAFEHEGGGFVLVSGEDAGRPVLAYAFSGRFPAPDQMPANLRDMLDFYSAVLYRARVMGWRADAALQQEWSLPTKAAEGTPVILETAKWNQWSPYNDLCPKINGQECPCGCVATAMAIIMRYHKWPAKGTGTIPGYDFGWDGSQYQYHQDGITLGHVYDWDAMSMEGNFSQAGRGQVARLLMDLGIMSQMDYNPSGSGAASISPIKLATYFDYDKQMRYYDREGYTQQRWEELVRDEIDAKRPVFYCGSSNSGGHAFVIDGYNGRYFRINYGWGGVSNAFYTLSPVDGHESDLTEFSKYQDMVCRIMPNQGGSPYVNLRLSGFASFSWNFQDPSFMTGQQAVASYSYASTGKGPTELCYCLYDKEGQLKEVLSDPVIYDNSVENDWYYLPSVNCKAPSQVADGDVIQISRPDERYGWVPLPGSRWQRIEFNASRPLAELVTPGHTYGRPATNFDYSLPSTFFFRAYRDIYWEIRRVEDGRVMATSATMAGYSNYGLDVGYSLNNITSGKGDQAYYSFWLAPGRAYEILFRNFTEEMKLQVVL